MKRILGCATIALMACGGPTPKEVADSTGTDVSELVRGAFSSAETTNSMSSLQLLSDGFSTSSSGVRGSPPGAPYQRPTVPAASSADASLAQFKKFMTERVFTDDNLESSGGGSAVFLLKGASVCTDGTVPASPACIDQVDRLQVRVRATPQGKDGMDLTLLIGASRFEPLSFKVRKASSLALEVNLADAKSALELANTVIGGAPLGLPRVLEGVVQLKLQKNGELDYTLSASTLAAVRVQVDDGQGSTRSFQTAAVSPLSSVRVEGLARRLTFSYDLGETEYTGPYADVSKSTSSLVPMTVHLAGLSYAFSADEGTQNTVVAHVGIGEATSFVSYGGQNIITADLNKLSGRHFDVNLSRDVDNLPLVKVLPEVDLSVLTFLQPLVAAGTTVDPAFANETYHLLFTGGGAPTLKPVPSNGAFAGGLKVLSGSLTLATSRPNTPAVVVNAGQCLTGTDSSTPPPPSAHPLLGSLRVVSCP